MRITNKIMTNSALNNVAVNKRQMNTLDTQLSTQKKINRPSEDPIIAIRALRLRTNLKEVTQYLDKNIPDANSWMDVTEGALNEANDIISDVYKYCVQGSTETLSTKEREVISEALKELRSSIYSQGDVDYAGRYVFTGYKTDTSLTFSSEEDRQKADYQITQSFGSGEFDYKTVLKNPIDIDAIKEMSAADIAALDSTTIKQYADYTGIDNETVHRIKLAYTDIKDSGVSMSYTAQDGSDADIPLQYTTDPARVPGDDEVLVNTETGEILMGQNIYEQVFSSGSNLNVTYEKDKFVSGDVRPEHYFDCTDLNTGIKYKQNNESEDINYNINFNQKIKVNTEAKDCLSTDIGRDIDDIINAVDDALAAQEKLTTLNNLKSNPNYASDECQANLEKLIEAAQKELDLKNDTLNKAFESGITNMQNHQEIVDIAVSDVGNRMARLDLTKSRLETQKTNFTNLKSENEDVDLEEVVVNYTSAELVYNASLTAASRSVRQTLLDFI